MDKNLTPAKPVIMATVITALVGAIVVLFVYFNTKLPYENNNNKHNVQIHQFTHCIQVVMEESRKNNKPATAEEAKSVCAELQVSDNLKHRYAKGD